MFLDLERWIFIAKIGTVHRTEINKTEKFLIQFDHYYGLFISLHETIMMIL